MDSATRSRCRISLILVFSATLLPACSMHAGAVAPYPYESDRVAEVKSAVSAPWDDRAEQFISHVALLAHDQLEGRGTGQDGIDLAAGYIAGQFAATGLTPGGTDGTYFQEFSVDRPAKLKDETRLTVSGASIESQLRVDFTPFGFSAKGDFSGPVTFVGYGITDSEKDYDDYAGADVTGHVVLMFRREPPDFIPGGEFSDNARFDSKVKLAKKNGAQAVLIVNQDPGEDGIDGLRRFRVVGDDYGLPAMQIKRRVADAMLAAGGLASLDKLQQQLDEGQERVTAVQLADISAMGTVAYGSEDMKARNVVGVLPGSGPHAEEYVVVGAHYDHLGIRGKDIYNGADDNASGTAGVIELAKSLSKIPDRDRSVIFVTFAGEEMGLLGSKHYASDPTVPFDSITAMVNMDMIGRLNEEDEANKLAIMGLGTGDSFKEIVSRRAKEVGLKYLPSDGALTSGGSSDHAPFYRAGIPALFFFTGIHQDYHQTSDDTELINAEGAVKILALAHGVVADLINDAVSPVYAEVTETAPIMRGGQTSRGGVVMGIIPDMEDESEAPGWRVGQVFPGGGAEKAGMKAGDRILRIEGTTIDGFGDYRKATSGKKPGDAIDVDVLRKGKSLTLHVELKARGG